MRDKLKDRFVEALKTHDWNYESQPDEKFDQGVKQKTILRSLIAEAYEHGKDPARLFYQYCPEHLHKDSADYGIRTPWSELRLHLDILQEQRQQEFKKNVKHRRN